MARKKRKPSKLPETRTQGDALETREQGETPTGSLKLEHRDGEGHYWPGDTKQPDKWHVRSPHPCPECKLVRWKNGVQAVICIGIAKGTVAYLRCRGCGHSFQLPVVRI